MASEFITRVERDKDEPYTVIFRTDDADKYKHIEDECRRTIGHKQPTVDAVPVVRCGECEHGRNDGARTAYLHDPLIFCKCEASYKPLNWFCAGGERKENNDE